MKVLLSGGHLTPALAVIEYMQTHQPAINLEFVGRMYAQPDAKQKAHEKREVESRNVIFHPFSAPNSQTNTFFHKLILPIRLLRSFFSAVLLLLKVKPDIFLSFGSYLSVPIAYACWLLRIPIVIHEQTKVVGRATKALLPLADAVAVSYPELLNVLPEKKTVVTGNPIRVELKKKRTKKPKWLAKTSLPLIYITGGSQGSEIINTTVSGAIKQLSKTYTVIHQCGLPNTQRHYKNELDAVKKNLPANRQSNYIVREWISDQDLAWVLSHVQCAVSRAGANTITELILKQVPTVFIPLPFSIKNEQLINAIALKKKKAATLLEQKDLSPKSLIKSIDTTFSKRKKIKEKLTQLPLELEADKKLTQLVIDTYHKR